MLKEYEGKLHTFNKNNVENKIEKLMEGWGKYLKFIYIRIVSEPYTS